MNKKVNNTKRTIREPELQHIMLLTTLAIIFGFSPLALLICRMCFDYDVSDIIDMTYLYLGGLCSAMGLSVRYMIMELEHMTDLYYNSNKFDKIDRSINEIRQILETKPQSTSSSTETDKA